MFFCPFKNENTTVVIFVGYVLFFFFSFLISFPPKPATERSFGEEREIGIAVTEPSFPKRVKLTIGDTSFPNLYNQLS